MIESTVEVVKSAISQHLNRNSQVEGGGYKGQTLYLFFRLLAVCHTVVVDKDPKTGEVVYQASSPDELALIEGAKQVGFVLLERTQKLMKIFNELSDKVEEYEIIRGFPFDSDRKRMTLVVKHEGRYLLMTKGADSVMIPRIVHQTAKSAQRVKKELTRFATEGLRTLVVCQRDLSRLDCEALD